MQRSGRDIPAGELEVLGALWERGSATARELQVDLAAAGRRLAPTTVLTLLERLERRGYVARSGEARPRLWRPRISKERVAADRMGLLVSELGGGEPLPLILRLVETRRLSPDDIRRLRKTLDDLEERLEDGTGRRGGRG